MLRRLAQYRRYDRALVYSAEIKAKFHTLKAYPVPHPFDFGWTVQIETKEGHTAYALPRPRNYTRYGIGTAGDILSGTYRVPNDKGL